MTIKTYRLKPNAPEHYVQGYGIIRAGATFQHAGPPISGWCEEVQAPAEVEKAKPERKRKDEPKQAEDKVEAAPAADTEPKADDGEF